jgi:hypothetical protein
MLDESEKRRIKELLAPDEAQKDKAQREADAEAFMKAKPGTIEGDDVTAVSAIEKALQTMRDRKPNDRSEKDRRYAVAITEQEKVLAYFREWVIRG